MNLCIAASTEVHAPEPEPGAGDAKEEEDDDSLREEMVELWKHVSPPWVTEFEWAAMMVRHYTALFL